MTKEELIFIFTDMLTIENKKLEFTQMAMGRHLQIASDGWRTIIISQCGRYTKATLEKNPSGYFLYSQIHRFDLTEQEGENLVSLFDSANEKRHIPIEDYKQLIDLP